MLNSFLKSLLLVLLVLPLQAEGSGPEACGKLFEDPSPDIWLENATQTPTPIKDPYSDDLKPQPLTVAEFQAGIAKLGETLYVSPEDFLAQHSQNWTTETLQAAKGYKYLQIQVPVQLENGHIVYAKPILFDRKGTLEDHNYLMVQAIMAFTVHKSRPSVDTIYHGQLVLEKRQGEDVILYIANDDLGLRLAMFRGKGKNEPIERWGVPRELPLHKAHNDQ